MTTLPMGSIVYLTSCIIKAKITAEKTMPDTPDLYGAELEVMDDRGAMDLSAIAGRDGPNGQVQFSLRRQDDITVDSFADLPDDLSDRPEDVGKYYVISTYDSQGTITEQWAYIWYGSLSGWRKTYMGSEGPPGPLPRIRPTATLIDPATDSYVDTGGTTLAPSWEFNLAVKTGNPGPVSALADLPDYDGTPAPEDGMVLMCSGDETADGYPIWRPANVLALAPRVYSVPESAFTSFTGSFSNILSGEHRNIATFAIPPQPFDWTPVVWGHIAGTQRVFSLGNGITLPVFGEIEAAVEDFLDRLQNGTLLEPVTDALTSIVEQIANVTGIDLSPFSNVINGVLDLADDIVSGIVNVGQDIIDTLADIVAQIVGAIGIRPPQVQAQLMAAPEPVEGASGASGGGEELAGASAEAPMLFASTAPVAVMNANGFFDLGALVTNFVNSLTGGTLLDPVATALTNIVQQVTNVTGIDLSGFSDLTGTFLDIADNILAGTINAGIDVIQTLTGIVGALVGGVKAFQINVLIAQFVEDLTSGELFEPVIDTLTGIVEQVSNLTGVDLSPFSSLVNQFLNIADDAIANGVNFAVEIARALGAVVSQIVDGVVDIAAGITGASGGGGWWGGGGTGASGASGGSGGSGGSGATGQPQSMFIGLAGLDPRLRIGCRVLLGDSRKQVARGFGMGRGQVNIMPHYSTPGRRTRNITPINGYAVVPANHTDPAEGTLHIDLHNDGVFGSFNFDRTNSQLLVMVVPIDAYDTYVAPTTRRLQA